MYIRMLKHPLRAVHAVPSQNPHRDVPHERAERVPSDARLLMPGGAMGLAREELHSRRNVECIPRGENELETGIKWQR